jgi:transposase-like protein
MCRAWQALTLRRSAIADPIAYRHHLQTTLIDKIRTIVIQKWLHNFRQGDEWNLCLTAGTIVARESGATMSRRARRNHSAAFKAKVALAAIKGDRTIAQLADQFDVHANQITTWKAQLEGGAADVFGPGGGSAQASPSVDVKALHAKIGELTLENDFLEGALSKAGLLNARR